MTENNDFNNTENDSNNSRNEKRFKLSEPHGAYLVDDENYIVGHWDNDDDKIIDLLNSLNKENGQLKIRLNEEKEKALKFCRNIDTLIIENEQLKNELRIYRKLANCSNCQYHNYDTLFGGDDEYEVCDKGNDVTDSICKDWREL